MLYPALFELAFAKAGISREEWLAFEPKLRSKSFKKGAFLARPGEEADLVHIVVSGVVRNYQVNSSGREFTKVLRGPGGLIASYQEILSQTKVQYFIQAIMETEVLQFSYKDFKSFMDRSHAWERLGRIIAEENYLEKERREFMFLHMSTEERYKEFLKEFWAFKDEIPQYQVANFLGISPEALNRLLKKSAVKNNSLAK